MITPLIVSLLQIHFERHKEKCEVKNHKFKNTLCAAKIKVDGIKADSVSIITIGQCWPDSRVRSIFQIPNFCLHTENTIIVKAIRIEISYKV